MSTTHSDTDIHSVLKAAFSKLPYGVISIIGSPQDAKDVDRVTDQLIRLFDELEGIRLTLDGDQP